MTSDRDFEILDAALRRCRASWEAAQAHGFMSARLSVAGAGAERARQPPLAQGQLQPSGGDSLTHRLVLPACRHFASLSPSIPATIRAMHASLRREWDSPKSIIPSNAVPAAPMPVQTA